MSKIYNLMANMEKIDYEVTHWKNFGFKPKEEYYLKDFFSYFPSVFFYYLGKLFYHIYNKTIKRLNFRIAKK